MAITGVDWTLDPTTKGDHRFVGFGGRREYDPSSAESNDDE